MAQVIHLGPASRMLTTREAAARLAVSLRTVQLWVEASILPATKTPGGHRRIPYGAVEALAASMGLAPERHVADEGAAPRGAASRMTTRADVLLIAEQQSVQSLCIDAIGLLPEAVDLRVAPTGYVGLIHIGERTPDLLIVSPDLPGMNLKTMLETLDHAGLLDGLHVMVLPSQVAQGDDDSLGNLDVLTWPLSQDALAARMGHWLLSRHVTRGACHE